MNPPTPRKLRVLKATLSDASTLQAIKDDPSADNLAPIQQSVDQIVATLSALYPHQQCEVLRQVVQVVEKNRSQIIENLEQELSYLKENLRLQPQKRKRFFFF